MSTFPGAGQDGRGVVLVTGASSGFGLAIAEHLARQGYRVYGTSRRAPAPDAAGRAEPPGHVVIELDVRSDASVARAVESVLGREGRLDVVVNNAGFGIAGALEDTTAEELREQFETNVFGLLRVCRAVLPHMRERRSGRIINVGSLAGLIALPFQGAYSASKFAVEGLTEALRMEAKPHGIHVSLLEPGDFRTDFTANRVRTASSQTNSAYAARFRTALDAMERDERSGPGPEILARLVERIIAAPAPRLRYTAGAAMQRAAVLLKRALPGSVFEWILLKSYGL